MDASVLASDFPVMNVGFWLHAYIRPQIADRMSAGPDGFRQERPHLHPRAASAVHISGLRSCGPTRFAITC